MQIGIYIVASIIIAAISACGTIEKRYLTGKMVTAVECFLYWLVLLYFASFATNWWIPVLLAVPGGATLKFSILNVVQRYKLFEESFNGQVRDVVTLIQAGLASNMEILTYLEPPAKIWSGLGHEMLIMRFKGNPSLGIMHGRGRGHAFVRVGFLREVVNDPSTAITDYASLVRAFRDKGYDVIRDKTVHL